MTAPRRTARRLIPTFGSLEGRLAPTSGGLAVIVEVAVSVPATEAIGLTVSYVLSAGNSSTNTIQNPRSGN